MFSTLTKSSISLPALWLVFAALNACAMAATYPYTVYRGTFVHLPKLNSSSTKPELARNQGALWVGEDGRIKGYDWSVHDDATFKSFLSSHGWADADAGSGNTKATKVKVVKSNDARNEFFFPGFIGMHSIPSLEYIQTNSCRHPHPRPSISQHRTFRIFRSARLAERIYLPNGS